MATFLQVMASLLRSIKRKRYGIAKSICFRKLAIPVLYSSSRWVLFNEKRKKEMLCKEDTIMLSVGVKTHRQALPETQTSMGALCTLACKQPQSHTAGAGLLATPRIGLWLQLYLLMSVVYALLHHTRSLPSSCCGCQKDPWILCEDPYFWSCLENGFHYSWRPQSAWESARAQPKSLVVPQWMDSKSVSSCPKFMPIHSVWRAAESSSKGTQIDNRHGLFH